MNRDCYYHVPSMVSSLLPASSRFPVAPLPVPLKAKEERMLKRWGKDVALPEKTNPLSLSF